MSELQERHQVSRIMEKRKMEPKTLRVKHYKILKFRDYKYSASTFNIFCYCMFIVGLIVHPISKVTPWYIDVFIGIIIITIIGAFERKFERN